MIPVNQLGIYLPHEVEFVGGGDRWTLYSLRATGAIVLKNGLHTEPIHQSNVGVEYQPILRPMKSLTRDEKDLYFSETYGYMSTWKNELNFTAWKLNWFIQRKFDVFGLIEQGLATDYYSISNVG